MQWELAHRRRDAAEATHLVIEAPSSREEIDQLKTQIPEDEVVLYIKAAE
jgi:hypothetical protein